MGQAYEKPLVIEFNGIPGAGKTTTMYEMRKTLKAMKVREISPQEVVAHQINYKEILLSKKIRDAYIIFLKACFLISPITIERLKYMNFTFNYWLGVKKLEIYKKGICVLDQGIVQGFVSMAYQGKIKNEKMYYGYLERVLSGLDNIVCVNCNIDVDTSKIRMKTRKSRGGRLYEIKSDKQLTEVLLLQNKQFEKIRRKAVKKAITINMDNDVQYNVGKIIEYCFEE